VQMPVAPGFQQDLFLINHAVFMRGMEQERKASIFHMIREATKRFPPKNYASLFVGPRFSSRACGMRSAMISRARFTQR
jgi:hypothetical protein